MPYGGPPMDAEYSYHAANLAIRYLRKMRQWNAGLIDMAVPGEDPPYRMTEEQIIHDMQAMIELRDAPDE